jgi:hypothetical protein
MRIFDSPENGKNLRFGLICPATGGIRCNGTSAITPYNQAVIAYYI